MKKQSVLLLFLAVTFLFFSCAHENRQVGSAIAPGLKTAGPYTLLAKESLFTAYEPINTDGTINVVVEIPAGTNEKWEVVKPDGNLELEFRDGKPRIVRYLPYPGNYGFVPRTLLPVELGGDGDPLDVILLGPSLPRGSVVKAKLVGVLKLLDRGEQDDKILAISTNSPLLEATSLAEINTKFSGITSIIETWFTNYKGQGMMKSNGFGDEKEAGQILETSIKAFGEKKTVQEKK